MVLLSLEKQTVSKCSVWSDCKDTFTGDAVSNEALAIKELVKVENKLNRFHFKKKNLRRWKLPDG